MSHHSTSEEQFEEIKEFLAKSWKIIAVIVIIGLLSIWGWRYWKSYQHDKSLEASDRYEQLIAKLDTNNPQSVDELVSFAKDTNTVYSVFANMKAAQFYVETLKDYAGAKDLLTAAAKETDSAPILAIINIRIARLQVQLGEYEESLKTLAKVKEESWTPVVDDIKADVFVKLERFADAVDAYEVALMAKPTPELEKNIKMKLNQAQYLKAKQELEQAKLEAEKEKAQQQPQESAQ
ncbi:tetratricopeptide repeat protein [Orbaceae bacterium ac157xtp]